MAEQWQFPNKATPEGSANYYVVRFSPTEQRDALALWYAWFALIEQIEEKATDPGVARLKLDWWREELRHIQQQQARHPLAQAMHGLINHDWQIAAAEQLLELAEDRIRKLPVTSLEDYLLRHATQGKCRFMLMTNNQKTTHQQPLEAAGLFCQLLTQFNAIGQLVRRDHLRMPQSLLQTHEISLDSLSTTNHLPGLSALGETLFEAPLKDAKQSLRHLRAIPSLHSAAAETAQALALYQQIHKQAFAVNQKRFQNSPLRLLWSAWRKR